MTLRLDWRVASLIISTNSDLSATARSLRNALASTGPHSAPRTLTTCCQNVAVLRQQPLPPFPDIDEMPGNRGGRRHRRRHQMGAALETLPALEIAGRGGSAALFGQQLVGIHCKAHRAARLAPFETG